MKRRKAQKSDPNGDHIVPLASQAVAILEELKPLTAMAVTYSPEHDQTTVRSAITAPGQHFGPWGLPTVASLSLVGSE